MNDLEKSKENGLEQLRNTRYNLNAWKKYRDLIEQLNDSTSCYSNEIIPLLDEIIFYDCKEKFIKHLPQGTSLYRARIINQEDVDGICNSNSWGETNYCGYDENNSRECPLLVGGNGRNNIAGQSYLYVAEDESTACAEIKAGLRDFISLAKFRLKEKLEIIDFSQEVAFEKELKEKYEINLANFFANLMMRYSIPVINEKEYKSTQIISDYLRKTGIDGIAYMSFYTGKSNYTIFNCHPSKIEFVNSRMLLHKTQISSFWDFTNKKSIVLPNDGEQYDTKEANDIIRRLTRGRINREE